MQKFCTRMGKTAFVKNAEICCNIFTHVENFHKITKYFHEKANKNKTYFHNIIK